MKAGEDSGVLFLGQLKCRTQECDSLFVCFVTDKT